jgi:hypothetical protein
MAHQLAHRPGQVFSFDFAIAKIVQISIWAMAGTVCTARTATFSTLDKFHDHATPESLEFQGCDNEAFLLQGS